MRQSRLVLFFLLLVLSGSVEAWGNKHLHPRLTDAGVERAENLDQLPEQTALLATAELVELRETSACSTCSERRASRARPS
jgi:hypothetical protein